MGQRIAIVVLFGLALGMVITGLTMTTDFGSTELEEDEVTESSVKRSNQPASPGSGTKSKEPSKTEVQTTPEAGPAVAAFPGFLGIDCPAAVTDIELADVNNKIIEIDESLEKGEISKDERDQLRRDKLAILYKAAWHDPEHHRKTFDDWVEELHGSGPLSKTYAMGLAYMLLLTFVPEEHPPGEEILKAIIGIHRQYGDFDIAPQLSLIFVQRFFEVGQFDECLLAVNLARTLHPGSEAVASAMDAMELHISEAKIRRDLAKISLDDPDDEWDGDGDNSEDITGYIFEDSPDDGNAEDASPSSASDSNPLPGSDNPLIGKRLAFIGPTLTGRRFNTSSLSGKIVLVDFWATWCPPCVASIPDLVRLHEKYQGLGVEFVGVSLDHNRSDLVNFVKEYGVPWTQIYYGEKENPMIRLYKVEAIPTIFVLDGRGRLRAYNPRGEAEIESVLQFLIAENQKKK